ncbi:MAG: asparaginase [Eubacteriales bacterium]|nr:asparaginase [Eubacteriales bacterium]
MEVLAKTYRGELADLFTHGTWAVVDAEGRIIAAQGDPKEYAFARSSAKLLQALLPLSLGASQQFDWSASEIAQICASHSGEQYHIETVTLLLQKIGLNEAALQCGPHYPFDATSRKQMEEAGETARAIHNNCSGKHAGMLTAAILMGADPASYYHLSHPVQQAIIEIIQTITDLPETAIKLATDGCSVPVHAVPIAKFAYAMARLAAPETLPDKLAKAAVKITQALRAEPKFASGTERIDRHLIERASEPLVVKSGANGYYAGFLPDRKWGFALKTYDGNGRIRDLIASELLYRLGAIDDVEMEFIREFTAVPVKNWRGDIVGHVETCLNA